jgi:hypothetical protein
MPRLIVTALSAMTMVFIGIVSLQYRYEEISGAGLSGNSQEALNMTRDVAVGQTQILANALPQLFIIVLLAIVAMAMFMVSR